MWGCFELSDEYQLNMPVTLVTLTRDDFNYRVRNMTGCDFHDGLWLLFNTANWWDCTVMDSQNTDSYFSILVWALLAALILNLAFLLSRANGAIGGAPAYRAYDERRELFVAAKPGWHWLDWFSVTLLLWKALMVLFICLPVHYITLCFQYGDDTTILFCANPCFGPGAGCWHFKHSMGPVYLTCFVFPFSMCSRHNFDFVNCMLVGIVLKL